MGYKVCYWDSVQGVQAERDCTPEEVADIEARKAAAVSPAVLKAALNASLKDRIIQLENTQARVVREAALTGDKTRLKTLDDAIAAIRGQLQ